VRPLNPASDNPLSNATFTRLTNFESDEAEATLSPDGKFAAFLSDRDGPLDVWLTQVGSGRFSNLSLESHMPGLRPVRNIGFSGDGSDIWFGGAPVGRMRIMPMMGGPTRPFLGDRAVEVVWSSDGARMVYHSDAPGDPMFVADRTGAGAKQIFVDPDVGGHEPLDRADPGSPCRRRRRETNGSANCAGFGATPWRQVAVLLVVSGHW
jgi:hypothetical protein